MMTRPTKYYWWPLFTASGGLSGVLAVLVVIWRGGELNHEVRVLDTRVSIIETLGSVQVQKHIAIDDARVGDARARLDKVEVAVEALPRIEVKLDLLKEELRQLQAQLSK